MTFRKFAACALAVAGLAVAGCGDDDEQGSTGTTTTAENSSAKTISDIEPRATKPNIVGGGGPIDQFLTSVGNDAIGYWGQVFQNSNLPYKRPTIRVATAAGDNGCGEQFDPTQRPFFLCLGDQGSVITLGAPLLDKVRNGAGDAGVAFLAGFAVAVDTNDQLTGGTLAEGGQIDQQFATTAACFTGAWIRNLADKQLLEAGDDQEVLRMAEQFIGQGIGAQSVAQGFNQGAGSCQGGGSDGGDEGEEGGGDATPVPGPGE
jgi:predicted metalloprotease